MNKLIFWTIYLLMTCLVYLLAFPSDKESVKMAEIGIKSSTIYLLKQLEGVRHTAYDDGHGNMTIGVGHLIKDDEPQLYYATLSKKQINTLLERDIRPCSATIKNKVNLPLSQPQFDALISFCHNIGPDRFASSDVVKYINKGKHKKAADAMLNWNKPSSVINRRKQERNLFLQGA